MNIKRNVNKNAHSKKQTTRFLIISFSLLLLISIGTFITLGHHMNKVTEESINTLGNIYMSGINDHITAHFRTLIDLKLEQAEAVVEVVPSDPNNTEKLYEELIYRVKVRNFNYLALCSENGDIEMLDGAQIHLADPDPFYNSLRNNEKKVAVGNDANNREIVAFGVSATYPMKSGEKSVALIAAVPIEYISTMLSTYNEQALVYSHIIRKDGSFIIDDDDSKYTNYFSSLYSTYPQANSNEIDGFVQEITVAMNQSEAYTGILNFGENNMQVYCTPLPYSEWHLVTLLPFGILNETLENLNSITTTDILCVSAIIVVVILLIFFIYFKMTFRQLKALEIARKEALDATKAKSLFLSNMSHDIRTPMNAIVGMTTIAISHIDNKEQVQNCLKKISLSGKHLLGLINDVLDMSKIESGKMALTSERISLREVIEGVVGIEQSHIKEKKQNFNVHIDNIIAEDVYSDSVRLNQILLNLLSNAVKYTQEGGTVQLTLFQEDAPPSKGDAFVRTHIVVKDNGIGMSEEFLQHVFDSYTRADSKRVHKTEGAGLGMAITKHIVDAMNGTITVESELNKGSEFHVILDLEKAPFNEDDMLLPQLKMLVIDDDEFLCRTVVDTLATIGVKADWTLNGDKALEMVTKYHQTKDRYQIILLDWKLADSNGLSVAKQIRQIVGNEMPIILISAYDWSEFEAEAKLAGINGFISKPLFKSTLFYGIRKYINSENAKNEKTEDTALIGRRILVAEDNNLNWEILNELLSDAGMQLEWAENGQICLERFLNSEEGYYDAILMDVRMPVMGGYETTKSIRALNRQDAQTIPIIAMTADAFSEDVKRSLDSGMNAHTAKPINLDELLLLLKKFIL